MKKSEVETDADREADRGVHGRAEERIESEPQVEEVRSERPEHDELSVRDVHDLRDAPDEVQAVRDDREDAAEQQAEDEIRGEDFRLTQIVHYGRDRAEDQRRNDARDELPYSARLRRRGWPRLRF